MQVQLVIQESNGSYSGTWSGPRGETKLEDVKIDGAKVSFQRELDTPRGKMKIPFEGTVAGDTLKGALKTPRGDRPIEGKRAQG